MFLVPQMVVWCSDVPTNYQVCYEQVTLLCFGGGRLHKLFVPLDIIS